MNLQQIIDVLVYAKKYIPEPARARLCFAFVDMLSLCIKAQGKAPLEHWRSEGANSFLAACKLEELPGEVMPNIRVKESLLAEFCNKWTNVSEFRQPGVEDWTPITPDMNSLRVTMVKELEELSKAT